VAGKISRRPGARSFTHLLQKLIDDEGRLFAHGAMVLWGLFSKRRLPSWS
jgi:hypothetical protein